jgi:PAS domain S-box-containing protein
MPQLGHRRQQFVRTLMSVGDSELGIGSSSASAAWSDATPHSHLVQFYENDDFLIESLARWFADGLSAGETCLFIGTVAHRISLERQLVDRGIALDLMRKENRYICCDAVQALSCFMVNESPNEALFVRTFESILATTPKQANIRAFGEMVALLWADGKPEAALKLEEIWNAFIQAHALSLCCAYPLCSFESDADASLFLKVCAHHTPVLPAESYTALRSPAERLRAISLLQHKAKALETEKAGRREAEKSLHLRQKELSDFFENAVEGLHQLGLDGEILWANPAQLKLLGYAADEYIGHQLAEFYVDRQRFDEFWQRLMRREIIYDFPAALRCKDGSIRHVLIHSSGLWENGKFLYTRCFIRDVTERVELEQELKVRLAELAQADQRKNEFLAMLGHELRNPLSAVLDAIATAQLDAGRRERALTIARRQTDQIAGLVDDLLDVGRITQGRIVLKMEWVHVGNIIRYAVEEAHCLVEPRHQQLSAIVSSEAERVEIKADPARLRQVIANLIHNAAKFTPPGGRIDVVVERNDKEVIVSVRDPGIGISSELLPQIFDLFTQAERSLDRSHGGLGIGLTIVKLLVEMHGGRVKASSEGPGKGSEFEVHLPIPTVARPPVTMIENMIHSYPQLKLLVIEDNADAAEALAMLLELYGHQVTVASDGLKAVEAVRDNTFDIALVDIGLPGIDGYEVAHRIRMLPNAKALTLVALTGYGQETDRRRALAAGFDEHLSKPVKIERLQALLNRPR